MAKIWHSYTERLLLSIDGETLAGADLAGADLRGANLAGADLEQARLDGAALNCADLSCANLAGAGLRGANLRHAELHRAVLLAADLTGADLTRADLRGAACDHDTRWPAGFDPQTEGVENRDERPPSSDAGSEGGLESTPDPQPCGQEPPRTQGSAPA